MCWGVLGCLEGRVGGGILGRGGIGVIIDLRGLDVIVMKPRSEMCLVGHASLSSSLFITAYYYSSFLPLPPLLPPLSPPLSSSSLLLL